MEFCSNLSAIYTKWCAQTFPQIFGLFAIFDLNFAKRMAPPSNENENYVVHLKEPSILKKRCKQYQNRPINRDKSTVQSISPSNEQRDGLERDRKNLQKTYKHHVFALTAGARSAIFPKVCTVIELDVPIKRCHPFLIQRIVFPTCREKFCLID